ncbi:MAG TPA: hypothetical protein VF638_00970 [Sphingomonas sp.]|jgi:hypothetical protein
MLGIAYRLWAVHPLNRVFRLGPFITERGLKAVLGMRPLLLSLGLFLTTWGVAALLFWTVAGGDVDYPPLRFLGAFASVFGIWSSILSVKASVRLWRLS